MRISRFSRSFGAFLLGGIFFVSGCSNNSPSGGEGTAASGKEAKTPTTNFELTPSSNNPPTIFDTLGTDIDAEAKMPTTDFETSLREIAQQYKLWTRVSDRANWAPTDCMMRPPVGVQASASHDTDTHGRKLYFLFAKDAQAYEQISFQHEWMADDKSRDNLSKSPVGQVLVKESWHPVEVARDAVPRREVQTGSFVSDIPDEYVLFADVAYHTGEKAGLFVMYKLDPQTPGTDEGWVYGTLSPDGAQVYQAGRIESCMNCHTKTDRDRLFGLPRGRKE